MFRKNVRERGFFDEKFSNDSKYIGMAENMKARHQINLIMFLSAALAALCAEAGCPPATPCGKPVTSSGSSGEHWSERIDFGTVVVNKPFPFEYDAYSIPDQFDVYKSTKDGAAIGNPVWSTNEQVSGYKSVTIPYNASTWGTNYAVVKVTGNNNKSTEWTFTMGCPGGSISNADREKDRKLVTFSLNQGNSSNILCDHLTYLEVDGTKYINSASSTIGTKQIEMSVGGPHRVAWSYTCGIDNSLDSPFPYLEIVDTWGESAKILTSPASFNVQ